MHRASFALYSSFFRFSSSFSLDIKPHSTKTPTPSSLSRMKMELFATFGFRLFSNCRFSFTRLLMLVAKE